jgi:hypothetical protein
MTPEELDDLFKGTDKIESAEELTKFLVQGGFLLEKTVITLFKEYCGLEIPHLPFSHEVVRDQDEMKGGSEKSREIYRTNVKVFQKNPYLRKQITELFLKAGFILEADHIRSVLHGGEKVDAYDRLIFKSPI